MCAVFALSGCGASDDQYAKVLVGTWGSREVAPDDVIVETQFTLLPGGRVNWQGQVRLLVPPDFYLRPDRPNFEVKNGRLIYYFTASGNWTVREGYLHTKIESFHADQPDAGRFRDGVEAQGSHQQGDDLRLRRQRADTGGIPTERLSDGVIKRLSY